MNDDNSPWTHKPSQTCKPSTKAVKTVTVGGVTVSETTEDEEDPKSATPLCPYTNPYAGTPINIRIKTPDEMADEQIARKEKVNHPSHYKSKDGKIEVIEIIHGFEHVRNSFDLGNAIKYILRAGQKDPTTYIEDLQKAIWYLQDEVNFRKNQQEAAGGC